MIEKTIIAVLRKTPTFNGRAYLKIWPDRKEYWRSTEGWGGNCRDWERDSLIVDESKLPKGDTFWSWYGDQLGVSPYDGEVWPKDYD